MKQASTDSRPSDVEEVLSTSPYIENYIDSHERRKEQKIFYYLF